MWKVLWLSLPIVPTRGIPFTCCTSNIWVLSKQTKVKRHGALEIPNTIWIWLFDNGGIFLYIFPSLARLLISLESQALLSKFYFQPRVLFYTIGCCHLKNVKARQNVKSPQDVQEQIRQQRNRGQRYRCGRRQILRSRRFDHRRGASFCRTMVDPAFCLSKVTNHSILKDLFSFHIFQSRAEKHPG